MTFETLVSAEPHGRRFNAGDIKDGILKLERTLRPNEGWIATVLLVINLVVVVWVGGCTVALQPQSHTPFGLGWDWVAGCKVASQPQSRTSFNKGFY